MNTPYSLTTSKDNYLYSHYALQNERVLADGLDAEEPDALQRLITGRSHDLQIYVKSGEYFSTLATILDGLSEHPELQQIVHDLMYLQEHYKIVKK